jgi:hypothetical protein
VSCLCISRMVGDAIRSLFRMPVVASTSLSWIACNMIFCDAVCMIAAVMMGCFLPCFAYRRSVSSHFLKLCRCGAKSRSTCYCDCHKNPHHALWLVPARRYPRKIGGRAFPDRSRKPYPVAMMPTLEFSAVTIISGSKSYVHSFIVTCHASIYELSCSQSVTNFDGIPFYLEFWISTRRDHV